MSLTFGPGPFSPHRAGVFSVDVPVTTVEAEPHPRRMRALRKGRVIVDRERGWTVVLSFVVILTSLAARRSPRRRN